MGIGRQSFYNTFGDKRQLYLEALETYQRNAISSHVGRLTSPTSPLGGLRDLLDGMKYVGTDPTIRMLVLVNFMIVVVAMPYTMLLPGFVKEVLHKGAFEQGIDDVGIETRGHNADAQGTFGGLDARKLETGQVDRPGGRDGMGRHAGTSGRAACVR